MHKYILLRCRTGLHDCLSALSVFTDYAIKYDRSIMLQFMMYKKTDLNEIFDFSNYPVKIILNSRQIINKIIIDNATVKPHFYKNQLLNPKNVQDKGVYIGYFLYNQRVDFDKNKDFPNVKLLVRDNGGSPTHDLSLLVKYIKLNDRFKKEIHKNLFYPIEYNAIHIRNTDCDIEGLKYKENYNKICDFIETSTLNVFLASDDYNILNHLKQKYKEKILLSNTKYYNVSNTDVMVHQHGNLHQFGTVNSCVLKEAFYDLFLLASAKSILITNPKSGYSRLAKYLCENKSELNRLIN
jgi:hypothetical protein